MHKTNMTNLVDFDLDLASASLALLVRKMYDNPYLSYLIDNQFIEYYSKYYESEADPLDRKVLLPAGKSKTCATCYFMRCEDGRKIPVKGSNDERISLVGAQRWDGKLSGRLTHFIDIHDSCCRLVAVPESLNNKYARPSSPLFFDDSSAFSRNVDVQSFNLCPVGDPEFADKVTDIIINNTKSLNKLILNKLIFDYNEGKAPWEMRRIASKT